MELCDPPRQEGDAAFIFITVLPGDKPPACKRHTQPGGLPPGALQRRCLGMYSGRLGGDSLLSTFGSRRAGRRFEEPRVSSEDLPPEADPGEAALADLEEYGRGAVGADLGLRIKDLLAVHLDPALGHQPSSFRIGRRQTGFGHQLRQ